jgi:hypothetical protein
MMPNGFGPRVQKKLLAMGGHMTRLAGRLIYGKGRAGCCRDLPLLR